MMMIKNKDIILTSDKLKFYTRNGWHLIYDPVNVSWIRLNDDGLKIFHLVKTYKKIDKILFLLSKEYPERKNSEIKDILLRFINDMVNLHFFHLNTFKKRNLPFFSQKFPEEIYLFMTNACNLKCRYCFNLEDRKKLISKENRTNLTLKEYKKIVCEAKTLGIKKFIFTGGEALLNPITTSLGRYILEVGLDTELISNGLLINKANVGKIAESFNIITISLDSYNKETHEFMRGKDTYALILKNLKLLKSFETTIRINSVITRFNVKEILKTWKFVYEDLKCDHYTPSLYTPDSDNPEVYRVFLPEINDIIKEQESIRKYYQHLPGIALKSPSIRFSCGIGNGEISISPEGDVFPCHTLHKSELLCGNLRDQGLGEIVENSMILKRLRNFNVNQINICKECDFKYLCGGGCLAMNYNINGDFFSKNNFYCEYLKLEQIERMWTSTQIDLNTLTSKSDKGHIVVTPLN
jgi:radical SAM protein with 4Fe4S-binding SPASM domain